MRPPRSEDRHAWGELWRAYQLHFGGNVPEDVSEATWRAFLEPTGDLRCLLAEDDGGALVGLAHFSLTPLAYTASPVCYLQDLFVEEGARGQGVGRALVQAVYTAADERGACNVFWLVDDRHHPTKQFYRRLALETPYVRFMRQPWPW